MIDEKKFLDREGVKYLWSQLSLEDYPNNETLIAILNAIDGTKADKTEIPTLISQLTNDSNFIDSTSLDNYYNKTEVNAFHSTLEEYTDNQVAALVNSAPETLDTLGELATAIQNNASVIEALDASIVNKQNKISDTLILVDTVTGLQHKIQIQNGQLVSFPIE